MRHFAASAPRAPRAPRAPPQYSMGVGGRGRIEATLKTSRLVQIFRNRHSGRQTLDSALPYGPLQHGNETLVSVAVVSPSDQEAWQVDSHARFSA